MKIKLLMLFALGVLSCGGNTEEKVVRGIVEKMEQRLHASNTIVKEGEEMVKGQGMKRILYLEFVNCQGVDLMDRALKPEMKAMCYELKNNISGSERIDKYKITLIKDPNDKTPTRSGLNISEKGFTFNREDF